MVVIPVPAEKVAVLPSEMVSVVAPSDNNQELIVPGAAPEDAEVNLPCASTVIAE